jgi:stearoyl-CoA desaturase (delta-9 desaturase)
VSKTGAASAAEYHEDIIYPETLPFVLTHVACLAAFWTGVRPIDLAVCVFLYVFRMFIVTAAYHRYFSHKSFKTSRWFQFVLAFLAQTAAQRGIVWWAATHREHHKYSDTELDVHSPKHRGFWFSHVGWIFTPKRDHAEYDLVPDLTKYPELMFLNTIWMRYTPAALLGYAVWYFLGWSGLVVGFFWSTVLLYHGSFSINSLAHVYGKQRYVTGDDSRNNWWLALITLGEGWHNNHHHFQASTRQGFYWWEIDFTYYGIKVLSWFGLVWDLVEPPRDVVTGERRLARRVVDKVAYQLAFSFPVERLCEQVREAWQNGAGLEELRGRIVAAGSQARARLAEIELPQLPSTEDLRARARQRYAETPSLDEVVTRAREILVEAVAERLWPDDEAIAGATA